MGFFTGCRALVFVPPHRWHTKLYILKMNKFSHFMLRCLHDILAVPSSPSLRRYIYDIQYIPGNASSQYWIWFLIVICHDALWLALMPSPAEAHTWLHSFLLLRIALIAHIFHQYYAILSHIGMVNMRWLKSLVISTHQSVRVLIQSDRKWVSHDTIHSMRCAE